MSVFVSFYVFFQIQQQTIPPSTGLTTELQEVYKYLLAQDQDVEEDIDAHAEGKTNFAVCEKVQGAQIKKNSG